jgi:hypothetical protein
VVGVGDAGGGVVAHPAGAEQVPGGVGDGRAGRQEVGGAGGDGEVAGAFDAVVDESSVVVVQVPDEGDAGQAG